VRRSTTGTDARVLSFAAVGFHGRGWWPRLTLAALVLTTQATPAPAQPAAAFVDLAPEFASAIARAVAPASAVRITFAPDQAQVQAEVVRLLSARGIGSVDSGDALPVRAVCSSNLRERVCAADVGRTDGRRLVMITRPRSAGSDADADAIVAIEVRPIYTQRRPMLDVAAAGEQLLVLSSESVALVADATVGNLGGRIVATRPITTARAWPRDVRGRLGVAGQNFEAFLPGVTCRGTIAPFTLVCADENESWPIGPDNAGIAPSRNTFSTRDGFTFYEAAPVGGSRWLLVSDRSTLTLVDNGRRTVVPSDPVEHAAGFSDTCAGSSSYLVTDARAADVNADTLRLFRLIDARLVASASTATLPGALTALWSAAGSGPATAIVHDLNAGRYEALHIALSCAR